VLPSFLTIDGRSQPKSPLSFATSNTKIAIGILERRIVFLAPRMNWEQKNAFGRFVNRDEIRKDRRSQQRPNMMIFHLNRQPLLPGVIFL
jgi:hypothetical protein